jgi:membrane protein
LDDATLRIVFVKLVSELKICDCFSKRNIKRSESRFPQIKSSMFKSKKAKLLIKLLKITFSRWFDRDPFREGAVIAYYSIFAIPGLLVVVISIAGYFFGSDVVSGHLHHQIAMAMGVNTANQVQGMLVMSLESKDSMFATIFGLTTIIIGATAVFAQLQKSLNNIWRVESAVPQTGIWVFFKIRLFSFGLIVSIAFLLLISLILSSLLSALGSWFQQYWSESLLYLFEIINVIISLGIITVLFALMFKILPDAKIKWRSVWIGAFITSVLFVIGKTALGMYFGTANPASGYGLAESIVLILLWTSYSSMILYLGAEFTKVYSDHHYGEVLPTENAVVKEVIVITDEKDVTVS